MAASGSPSWAVRPPRRSRYARRQWSPRPPRLPRGELPIIGDPIRDLTIWYAQRVSDANRAAVDNLSGRFLTPIDPLADESTREPVRQDPDHHHPAAHPRRTGARLPDHDRAHHRRIRLRGPRGDAPLRGRRHRCPSCGIFLVSVLAQFVIATDLAMVGSRFARSRSATPSSGRPEAAYSWSSSAAALIRASARDPPIGTPAPGSARPAGRGADDLPADDERSLLGPVERFLVLRRSDLPRRLRAARHPVTGPTWLKLLAAVLVVRFGWAIVFILFSLQVPAAPDDALACH